MTTSSSINVNPRARCPSGRRKKPGHEMAAHLVM